MAEVPKKTLEELTAEVAELRDSLEQAMQRIATLEGKEIESAPQAPQEERTRTKTKVMGATIRFEDTEEEITPSKILVNVVRSCIREIEAKEGASLSELKQQEKVINFKKHLQDTLNTLPGDLKSQFVREKGEIKVVSKGGYLLLECTGSPPRYIMFFDPLGTRPFAKSFSRFFTVENADEKGYTDADLEDCQLHEFELIQSASLPEHSFDPSGRIEDFLQIFLEEDEKGKVNLHPSD